MKTAIFIDSYTLESSLDDCPGTLTVGELIQTLQRFDKATPVYLKTEEAYGPGCDTTITYSSLTRIDINEELIEDEE